MEYVELEKILPKNNWLNSIIQELQFDVKDLDSIIRVPMRKLLEMTPYEESVGGNFVGIEEGCIPYLVLEQDKVISDIAEVAEDHRHVMDAPARAGGEKVVSGISRYLDSNPTEIVRYLAVVYYGYECQDHYSLPNWRLEFCEFSHNNFQKYCDSIESQVMDTGLFGVLYVSEQEFRKLPAIICDSHSFYDDILESMSLDDAVVEVVNKFKKIGIYDYVFKVKN